jgi:hypothetical protein
MHGQPGCVLDHPGSSWSSMFAVVADVLVLMPTVCTTVASVGGGVGMYIGAVEAGGTAGLRGRLSTLPFPYDLPLR